MIFNVLMKCDNADDVLRTRHRKAIITAAVAAAGETAIARAFLPSLTSALPAGLAGTQLLPEGGQGDREGA